MFTMFALGTSGTRMCTAGGEGESGMGMTVRREERNPESADFSAI